MLTIISNTNSMGAQALAKKKAIVSRLEAIEELAGVDILCSDKTGTLTKNILSLGDPILFEAKSADEIILAGTLASEKGSDDAIDKAVSDCLKDPNALDDYKVTKFVPFDPVGKRTEGDVTNATDAARAAAALILTVPGLSTIIDAIEESRQIFERIINYILFRVAMTLDIMFVVVQSFGLLMIGMEWLSNPEWQSWIKLTQEQVQTAVFLQIVAGGHLLLFVMRARGSLFNPPWPARPLLLAIVGTQIFAVLMCGLGWFVTAIPWTVIGMIWIYMLVWMLVLNVLKLVIYKHMHIGTAQPQWYTRFLRGRHAAHVVAHK